MNGRLSKRAFVTRPADPEGWIKAPDSQPSRGTQTSAFTARLTIDVTPDLRGRIKVAAFKHGVTVAHLLRDLLAREFPPTEGETS